MLRGNECTLKLRRLISFEPELQRRNVARVYSFGIAMLLPLVAIYWAIAFTGGDKELFTEANKFCPIYLMAVLAWIAYRVLRSMPDLIWSAAFWLPVQSAVFYGFGPLVEVYGNDATLSLVANSRLAITPRYLFLANRLSSTGIALLLVGFCLHLIYWRRAWIMGNARQRPSVSVHKIGVAFVLVGSAMKILILKPAQWSMISLTVPGFVSSIGNLADIGLGVMAFVISRGNRRMRAIFFLFWPLNLCLAFLSLAKADIVVALLLPLIGDYIARRNRRRLLMGLLAMAAVYAIAQPWVSFGRSVIELRTGTIDHAGYIERIDLVGAYLSGGKGGAQPTELDGVQDWWLRLSYAEPQAEAIRLRRLDKVSRSLQDAWMYVVPRAIWPDKPIMVGPGLSFYRFVTGDYVGRSFLGLSIYGDLYWQYGWPGVVFGCTLIGILFAAMAAQSVRAIRSREFIFLPVVLIALHMVLIGTNNFVSNGIIGPLPIYFVFYFLILRLRREMRFRKEV